MHDGLVGKWYYYACAQHRAGVVIIMAPASGDIAACPSTTKRTDVTPCVIGAYATQHFIQAPSLTSHRGRGGGNIRHRRVRRQSLRDARSINICGGGQMLFNRKDSGRYRDVSCDDIDIACDDAHVM